MGIQKTCIYNYSQLEVLNADEDDFFSDGDEPYFIYLMFKSRTATKGSTQTFLNTFANDEWAEGIEQGDKKAIPAFMGKVAAPVSLLDFADIIEAGRNKTPLTAEIVGVIGIAMESDSTPFGVVKQMISNLRSQVHTTIANIVENLPGDVTKIKLENLAPSIAGAVEKIKSNLTPSFAQKALIFLQSGGDPDDLVGITTQYNVCVDSDTLLLFNGLSGKKVVVPNILTPSNFSLDYKAKGVHYRVSGSIVLQ